MKMNLLDRLLFSTHSLHIDKANQESFRENDLRMKVDEIVHGHIHQQSCPKRRQIYANKKRSRHLLHLHPSYNWIEDLELIDRIC